MSNINSNERFVRWQTNLRNQVSFTNNLLLTISIGICGFFFNLVIKEDFTISDTFRAGIYILLLSVFLGIIANISRIIDFRLTLKKIKTEFDNKSNIEDLKYWARTFGKVTWILFYAQIASLFISLIFLSKFIYNQYLI